MNPLIKSSVYIPRVAGKGRNTSTVMTDRRSALQRERYANTLLVPDVFPLKHKIKERRYSTRGNSQRNGVGLTDWDI